MVSDQTNPTDEDYKISIERLAQVADVAPWLMARKLAGLIERGLLEVADGTPEQAVDGLRKLAASYAEERNA